MVLARVAAAVGLLVAAAGCGAASANDADGTAPVLATTSIWADVTAGVGCGSEIPALIPAGADPHTFEPSLRDREAVERATTVIANGLDLEASVEPMLRTAADDQGVDVIEMTLDIDVLQPDVDGDHDGDHDPQ
jgi:zinc/manganese transport system substrate-binding protein